MPKKHRMVKSIFLGLLNAFVDPAQKIAEESVRTIDDALDDLYGDDPELLEMLKQKRQLLRVTGTARTDKSAT